MLREVLIPRQTDADSTVAERRVVARAADDPANSRRDAADEGVELAPQVVVESVPDGPDEYGLIERWNGWTGALDVAHGGYRESLVSQ